MRKYCFTSGALVLAALLILGPSVTLAEPARIANIWDWKNHEPVAPRFRKRSKRRESRHLRSNSGQMTASSKVYIAAC
jgi:hypothetical protein